jgi:hypothetical protein
MVLWQNYPFRIGACASVNIIFVILASLQVSANATMC